jgi:hypothetical protein
VIDPLKIVEGTYEITFNDSLRKKYNNERSSIDISATYNVHVAQDPPDRYIIQDELISPENGIVFNGIRLSIDSSYQFLDSIKLKPSVISTKGSLSNDSTGWSVYNGKNLKFGADQFSTSSPTGVSATRFPRDYMIVFSNSYTDSSNKLTQIFGNGAPPINPRINFKIFDITNKSTPKRIQFSFFEPAQFRKDTLSFNDIIILSSPTGTDFSWRITFSGNVASDSTTNKPVGGDTLFLRFYKPLSSSDKFTFVANKPSYDNMSAAEQLSKVKAVPNPYIVTNVYEEPLPPTIRGRGERVVYFINLPPKSKIFIYTSSGNLVRTLEHDGDLNNGSVEWDLRTSEGLDVAYGVYFYVVEVDGISDKKTGKLAIIK